MLGKYCFVVPQNLEAATCVLLFKWLTGKSNVDIIISNENNLNNDLKNISFDQYKFVYVVGFYNLENIDKKADQKQFIFINKKITAKELKNARLIQGETTTVVLFFNFISKYTENTLNTNQQILYNSVVKYFTYNLDNDLLPLKLFYYFKTQPSLNKVESFVKRFDNGLIMFNESENLKLNIIIKDLTDTLKHIKAYKGNFKNNTVAACFGTKYINEISHRLLKIFKTDISIVINLDKNTVHYRRSKDSSTDLGKLVAENFNGYGTEYAAFSQLNSEILNLTKTFFPAN